MIVAVTRRTFCYSKHTRSQEPKDEYVGTAGCTGRTWLKASWWCVDEDATLSVGVVIIV